MGTQPPGGSKEPMPASSAGLATEGRPVPQDLGIAHGGAGPASRAPRRRGSSMQELGLLAVVVLLGTFIALRAVPVNDGSGHLINPFLRVDNFISILMYMTIYAVMAI